MRTFWNIVIAIAASVLVALLFGIGAAVFLAGTPI